MNAIGVEVSEHVLEGHASVTYQGWTHTPRCGVCMYTCPGMGAGRLVCVMVSVAVSGPMSVWPCGYGSSGHARGAQGQLTHLRRLFSTMMLAYM